MNPKPRVGLFVTCLVDLVRPSVGFAALKLLEQAGCDVSVPETQTCCGQPAWNSGADKDAATIARAVVDAFETFDYVVAPSGSCGGMIRTHYPEVLRDDPAYAARARGLAAKTHELVSFLVNVRGMKTVAARCETRACYHDSCSSLREMKVKAEPRALLAGVEGLQLAELKEPEVCCGFGGLFSVKYPAISERMADDKIADASATGAELLVGARSRLPAASGRPHGAQRYPDAGAPRRRSAGGYGRTGAGRDMTQNPREFPQAATAALKDENLKLALARLKTHFVLRRADSIERYGDWESLREQGRAIRDYALSHLDTMLESFERAVAARGGHVHWARDAKEAREIIAGILKTAGAKTVTKGKSMVSEEIALNPHLEAEGFVPVETDLGEYIIQLRKEPPSHIIAPAFHLHKEQVAETFRTAHTALDAGRNLDERSALVSEARAMLRAHFEAADAGITGANFLCAEEGAAIIVTNEGNGDLTRLLPKTHIVVTGIEKVVANLDDAAVLIRLLTRSATGQDISSYVSVMLGPSPDDGPKDFHIVLVDNGRSRLIGTEAEEVLRCIRCSACLNHCPIYGAVGGHAYGATYPGPIGAALNPGLLGVREAAHHANASTFCGRCAEVCPVKIPLPAIMRHWRAREHASGLAPKSLVAGLGLWAFAAKRPTLYRFGASMMARLLKRVGGKRGHVHALPLPRGWFAVRDFPAPQGKTFQQLWKERAR